MKLNYTLFSFFILVSTHIYAQDTTTITELRYQLVTHDMLQKSKAVEDAQLKGLLVKLAINFATRYGFEEELWGDLHTESYQALKVLIRHKVRDENPNLSTKQAYMMADLSFNQFQGHKPENKLEKQVAVRSVNTVDGGQYFYTAGGDGRILKWNSQSRNFEVIYQNKNINRVIALSLNEQWLAIATNDNEVGLLNLSNKKGLDIIKSHKTPVVVDLAFLPDNSGYVTVGIDRQVLISDFRSNKKITSIDFSPTSMDISPDGKMIAVASRTGEIEMIAVAGDDDNSSNIYYSHQEAYSVETVQFSPDSRYLAFGGYHADTGYGYVYIWDRVKKDSHGSMLRGFTSGITDIAFSPDGQLIAAASRDNTVRIWKMNDDDIYDLPIVLDDHNDWVWSIDFHPTANRLFSASADGIVRVFDLDLGSYEEQFCPLLSRNLTSYEWRAFVGNPEEFPWEQTCPDIQD